MCTQALVPPILCWVCGVNQKPPKSDFGLIVWGTAWLQSCAVVNFMCGFIWSWDLDSGFLTFTPLLLARGVVTGLPQMNLVSMPSLTTTVY